LLFCTEFSLDQTFFFDLLFPSRPWSRNPVGYSRLSLSSIGSQRAVLTKGFSLPGAGPVPPLCSPTQPSCLGESILSCASHLPSLFTREEVREFFRLASLFLLSCWRRVQGHCTKRVAVPLLPLRPCVVLLFDFRLCSPPPPGRSPDVETASRSEAHSSFLLQLFQPSLLL